MKGLLVMMLVMAGLAAGEARAAKPGGSLSAPLPPETLAALEDIAAASEARLRGEPLAVADASLAAGLDRLAASLAAIESQDALVAALLVEASVVGREVMARVASGARPVGGGLEDALDRLAEAKVDAARTHAGAEGPDNTCFLEYLACMVYCAGLPNAWQRSACGLGCLSDLLTCNHRHWEPVIDDVIPRIRTPLPIPMSIP